MIQTSKDTHTSPTLSNATLIETHGDEAPARWGHTAVWTGRGAEKAETWPTPRSYAGTIDETDHLISAQGHPLQDLRHSISGRFNDASTIAPCHGGNLHHKHTQLSCDPHSPQSSSAGCSCVRLDIQSRTAGVLDRDAVVNENSSSLFPSVWSGRRLQVIAGPGRGYQGYVSYNGQQDTYNLSPAIDFLFGFGVYIYYLQHMHQYIYMYMCIVT
jgi:hypothetical protein